MSDGEWRRAAVLAQVESGSWTVVAATERMELGYRQTKRLWKRYRKEGAAGLVHRSAGGISNRAQPKKLRAKALRLIRDKNAGAITAEEPHTSRDARYGRWCNGSAVGSLRFGSFP